MKLGFVVAGLLLWVLWLILEYAAMVQVFSNKWSTHKLIENRDVADMSYLLSAMTNL